MPETEAAKKIVLITGAARRLGRAMALDLSRHGWSVALHYNGSADAAEETVAQIREAGAAAMAFQADLSEVAAAPALIAACASALGPPQCLINNASLFEHDAVRELTPQSWQAHMDINLRAPVFLSQEFANALGRQAHGNIINILDQRVWKLTPDHFSYTVSKSALWTVTRTMAQALSPRIRVNAIGPGPTLASQYQNAETFARQQQATPLQRGPALSEVCDAVRFILDAPSMTGQMIALDGGQHLAWRTPDIEAESD